MKVRWLGNACIEVMKEDKNYLIDPNYLVEPKKFPEFVLLTHEHEDHFDIDNYKQFAEKVDLFAPKTALDKYGVQGQELSDFDVVNDVRVFECDCYDSDESYCFFDDGLLHTADASSYPMVSDDIKVLFTACFKDLYDEYVKNAKKLDPEIVIPYHYDPEEELSLAKGLRDKFIDAEFSSEILEMGETLEFDS